MRKLSLVLAAACLGSALSVSVARADCQTDVVALRQELEAKGKALEAAGKKKADPQTLCPLFRAFTTAEEKWTKFLKDNKEWCQIPAQAIEQAQSSHKKSLAMRDRVCQAAAAGVGGGGAAQPPAEGSISSALGITTGYTLGNTPSGRKGGGVFDTLSGNALQK